MPVDTQPYKHPLHSLCKTKIVAVFNHLNNVSKEYSISVKSLK